MKIEQAIQGATKGGWNPTFSRGLGVLQADLGTRTLKVKRGAPTLSYGDMFLDPTFWQALGKVEGWSHYETKDRFFEFADAIWKGDSAEQFISTL